MMIIFLKLDLKVRWNFRMLFEIIFTSIVDRILNYDYIFEIVLIGEM